ncbi:hypothetical protein ACFSQQ_13585 [Mesorhizobium kowhaii]|uniref:hypothetical protein n=1 Tax=Mesorhizobium kowhaii TaxID=1300272 RepID=UPI0035E5D532
MLGVTARFARLDVTEGFAGLGAVTTLSGIRAFGCFIMAALLLGPGSFVMRRHARRLPMPAPFREDGGSEEKCRDRQHCRRPTDEDDSIFEKIHQQDSPFTPP